MTKQADGSRFYV